MTHIPEVCLGVVAKNSIEYVDTVFSILSSKGTVVNLRDTNDEERITSLGIEKVIEPGDSKGWYKGHKYLPSTSEDIAQVLFTSGTEGTPKSILISHRALSNTTERLIDVMEIDSSIREYVGVPVNYSFGMGRCRTVSQVGGEFYIPPHGFDPSEISSLLSKSQINSLSAVPPLWRILLANAELFDSCGQKLKWIEIGSQYMSEAEKTALKHIFPNAKIIQHYGLTEASRSTFLKIHETEGPQLESVGQCIDDGEIKISEEGLIQIKGSHLASRMIVDNEVKSLVDKDGWFYTSDLGHIENGYLYYDGRQDDLINCGGVKISPDRLEQYIYSSLEIKTGLAVSSISDSLRGENVLLAYEATEISDISALECAFKEALLKSGVEAGNSLHIWSPDELPRTATGKLQRKVLRLQYEKYLEEQSNLQRITTNTQDSPKNTNTKLSLTGKVQEIWQDVLKLNDVPTNVSFQDLGGDSLSSISVALKMEKLGIERQISRSIFEGYTIEQIVSVINEGKTEKHESSSAKITGAINLSRGVLVLLVIAAHWMPGVIERLPSVFTHYNQYLSTLYSVGTPGFGVIFGVGVGFFYLMRYFASLDSLKSLVKRNAIILFSGMTLLAGLKTLEVYLGKGEIGGVDITNAYFSVLSYYFFAVISIPLWLHVLTKHKNITFSALVYAACFYLIHNYIVSLAIQPSESGLIQAGILMLTSKYNYFEMSTGILLGLALGNWIREHKENKGIERTVFTLGALSTMLGVAICIEMDQVELFLVWPKPLYLWSWALYFGFVSILFSISLVLVKKTKSAFPLFVQNIFACFGILAFPMFISHEMVIPFKEVLSHWNVPFALGISMLLFLAFTSYSVRKIYKVYFGQG